METNKLYIDPYIRLIFLVGSVAGTLLISDVFIYLCFYFLVILPVFLYSGQIKNHFQLLIFGMIPVFLSFILLYIIVLKGKEGDWNFIFQRTMKLILITSSIQLTLLIPSSFLTVTFKKWKIKGEALITLLGAFTVWTDVSHRAQKILTARFSRGFIKKRTFLEKIKQFPFVLIPLVIGVLRTSTERAESWEEKDIIYLMENNKYETVNSSSLLNVFLSISTCIWLVLGIYLFIFNHS